MDVVTLALAKKYTDEHGGSGAQVFTVTFNITSTEPQTVTCDKTVAEVIAAINAGKIIKAVATVAAQPTVKMGLELIGYGTTTQSSTTITRAAFSQASRTGWNTETIPENDIFTIVNVNGTESVQYERVSSASSLQLLQEDINTKSAVLANQALAGTEDELTSLKIDTVNYKISATRNFPGGWPISGTCEAFLAAVGADSDATPGKTYQGGVNFSDLSTIGLSNAEAEVEIISSTLSTSYKIIRLNIYSATNEPYSWARMYWWKGTAPSSTILPWQITARAADQYTSPVATGTVNNTTGVVTFTSGSWTAGVYLISMYGQQGGVNTSRTYYFAYGGNTTWMCYSADCNKSRMSSLNGSLVYTDDTGTGGPNWDADPSVELFKMR